MGAENFERARKVGAALSMDEIVALVRDGGCLNLEDKL